jgi:hypothetical protein
MPPSIHDALETFPPRAEHTSLRSLVHKRFADNVLLTDIRACGEDRFQCAGRLPTAHPFFTDGGRQPRSDILFYTELGRQASLAVSHAFLNVGLDDVFIFEQSEASMTEAAWRQPGARAAGAVAIEISIREAIRRKNALSRAEAEYVMWIGDDRVFSGTGAWTIQSAALFNRLRRGASRAAAGPAPVLVVPPVPGSTPNGNVVISPPECLDGRSAVVASLIVDPTHQYFFDHPCDHVPGMLLLEGCAQLSVATCAAAGPIAARALISAYDVNFQQFVECDRPTMLTARVEAGDSGATGRGPITVCTSISQGDEISGTARMRVAFPV